MNRHTGFSFAVVVLLVACGGSDASVKSAPGEALFKFADWEWQIEGICEHDGHDLSFSGPGDPSLDIGFNTEVEPYASEICGHIASAFSCSWAQQISRNP